MSIEQEILEIINQIVPTVERAFMDVFVLRHPGHANQKTHGNRFGAGQAKESLRRLKDDKGEREKYKARARQKLGMEARPERKPGKLEPKTTYGEVEFSKPATYSGRKRVIAKRERTIEGEIWSGDIRLELNESAKGSGLYVVENKWTDYSESRWGTPRRDALTPPMPLREAKKVSKVVLENALPDTITRDTDPEFTSKKVKQALKNAGYPVRVD